MAAATMNKIMLFQLLLSKMMMVVLMIVVLMTTMMMTTTTTKYRRSRRRQRRLNAIGLYSQHRHQLCMCFSVQNAAAMATEAATKATTTTPAAALTAQAAARKQTDTYTHHASSRIYLINGRGHRRIASKRRWLLLTSVSLVLS